MPPSALTPDPSSDLTFRTITDILIIGRGYTCLSATITLYRANHTTVIFDSHKYRNPTPALKKKD